MKSPFYASILIELRRKSYQNIDKLITELRNIIY